MLDTAFKEQLRQIFAGLEADYVFDIAVHPQHESRNELIELLEQHRVRIKYRVPSAKAKDWSSGF